MSKKNRPRRARPDYPEKLPGLRSDGAMVFYCPHDVTGCIGKSNRLRLKAMARQWAKRRAQ